MNDFLNYETIGDNAKPALLMVHGMLSSNYQWANNKDFLAQYFYLIMVEIWGHGNSPTPTEEAIYSGDSYCQQLEYIRTALNIEKWMAIGQSFGAGIVTNYALAYPQRVSHLVLTNSRIALGKLAEIMVLPKGPLPPLRTLYIHPIHAKRLQPDVKEQLITVADAVDLKAVENGMRQGLSLSCRDRLHQISCSTLLCQGIYEKAFHEPAEYAQTEIPNLQVVKMEAGHNPNRDAAEHFNQAILSFFRTSSNLLE